MLGSEINNRSESWVRRIRGWILGGEVYMGLRVGLGAFIYTALW